MCARNLSNIPHSVHDRLLNQARDTGRPFQELLQYYGMERFLYRLAQTPHVDTIVLKGARGADLERPTRDIDVLRQGDSSEERIVQIVRDAIDVDVQSDGMRYDSDSIEAISIAPDAEYQGLRVMFKGFLGTARVPMQIDVGVGDAVVPGPVWIEYPELLDYGPPQLRGYTLESVVAEKYQTMVDLDLLNTRLKDFYDVWVLSNQFRFDGDVLSRALQTTFERRSTAVPQEAPPALTEAFASNEQKMKQWRAFLRRIRIELDLSLQDTIAHLRSFLLSPSRAVAAGDAFDAEWKPGGPWNDTG